MGIILYQKKQVIIFKYRNRDKGMSFQLRKKKRCVYINKILLFLIILPNFALIVNESRNPLEPPHNSHRRNPIEPISTTLDDIPFFDCNNETILLTDSFQLGSNGEPATYAKSLEVKSGFFYKLEYAYNDFFTFEITSILIPFLSLQIP